MKKKGFTLLEVLIALVIFAIISIGVYGLLNQSLFMENYANDRLNLVLASTGYIYLNWENPPSETVDWREVESGGIDAYKVEKIPLGFHNIIKVNWIFKNGKTEIHYVFYY